MGNSVHPHACGEHPDRLCSCERKFGSSPRLWGTRGAKQTSPAASRFIPTPVGNTREVFELQAKKTVHPHACGEHRKIQIQTEAALGSSPRLWGTPFCVQHAREFFRFIPTPVGNTTCAPNVHQKETVHPHACGEHWAITSNSTSWTGSSPRLWGTLDGREFAFVDGRFIPTPVGNTDAPAGAYWPCTVHPHACGEHTLPALTEVKGDGSSPRLWGTQNQRRYDTWRKRFIPTPVGNTEMIVDGPTISPVHPHACGEHLFESASTLSGAGSSPRLWGTQAREMKIATDARFIPTPVGNTGKGLPRRPDSSVHPHACGEHQRPYKYWLKDTGSSPRLWGTHCIS